MPKRYLRLLAKSTTTRCAIGEEIVKRSLKPFPDGNRITKVLGYTTCPFTKEPAYIVRGKQGDEATVVAKSCIALSVLNSVPVSD